MNLCPNCESSQHQRCCAWCGKIHKPKRLTHAYCSVACERDAAHADKLSAAMEEER